MDLRATGANRRLYVAPAPQRRGWTLHVTQHAPNSPETSSLAPMDANLYLPVFQDTARTSPKGSRCQGVGARPLLQSETPLGP